MSRQTYDPSSKWMLEEQGASILYLAGERDVRSCRARQPEVVQPRQLPDGLLEVNFPGQTESDLFVIEVATYPERRAADHSVARLRVGEAPIALYNRPVPAELERLLDDLNPPQREAVTAGDVGSSS